MNRNKLKTYAPKARRDFIAAVTDRAAFFGLTKKTIAPVTEQGDVAIINGKPFPIDVADKRRRLIERIEQQGFDQVMEAMAYTWFNRLVAIRFMELHGYLDHGYRVLSHPEGDSTPEIIEHAEHVELPGLDKQQVIDLKLEGDKESDLYRLLLIAQCNALHTAMPFLFERIDDETELLLPDNLLHSDSLIRRLVGEIPEDDWQEVEIIGWLYQFYISEKKDEVIGKVVKSEDIPAATQLFTPNWIVKYLVQNSLGRQWVATYPNSPLKGQMEYYIEPAEQTPEVEEQLAAITPDSLDPEELTLLDPACGSGHILVEAYDLLKAIYQERGYPKRDIPQLILTKNLYGLEIDDRATQLAAFALLMKARADDRRVFEREVQPQVLSIQDSSGLDADDFNESAGTRQHGGDTSASDLTRLIDVFEHGKTLGALIQIPESIVESLPDIAGQVEEATARAGVFEHAAAGRLGHLMKQAQMLARQYGVVITNPPYMGRKYFTPVLKEFVNRTYPEAKADLYACFMERNRLAATPDGLHGMINIPNWMFLSSFEGLRRSLVSTQTIDTFLHNGRGVFGSDFGSCAFVVRKAHVSGYRGSYRKLFDRHGSVASNFELAGRFGTSATYTPSNEDFDRIPGRPIAYSASPELRDAFADAMKIAEFAPVKHGMSTGNNNRFLRRWHEVCIERIGFDCATQDHARASGRRWFPYNKGGEFRRWYGNNEYVVNYGDGGQEMRDGYDDGTNTGFRHDNLSLYFRPSITWSFVSASFFGVRRSDAGFVFDVGGSSAFPSALHRNVMTGFLCSSTAFEMMKVLNPTINFQVGNVASLPFAWSKLEPLATQIESNVDEAVRLARADWDSVETSWDFAKLPVLAHSSQSVQVSQESADAGAEARFARMKELEEANDRLFIDAYNLQGELSSEVSDERITLYCPDRDEDAKRLVSYVVGCMMGRYSLDMPGLIYAQSGNKGFDAAKYQTFPADDDGIVPLTDFAWFEDDAAHRFEAFIATAWPSEHLEENLKFVADSLSPKRNESPRDTIRRYLATDFYKHHLTLYKKRPIYWLFSSGKERAFQCLVYLHRYNEGTLSRMRTEYVIPLQGRIEARIEQLKEDIAEASSAAHRRRLEKEHDGFVAQQAELLKFDEKLRHYADLRISLDLDDGVKVNYGKFGDLLADVKKVTGKKPKDDV